MGSPCGEESLESGNSFEKCSVCGRLKDDFSSFPGIVGIVCNVWCDILPCSKLSHSQSLLALRKQRGLLEDDIRIALIRLGHTSHCSHYMVAINRMNCLCGWESKNNPRGPNWRSIGLKELGIEI
jgi:hypothetical protein